LKNFEKYSILIGIIVLFAFQYLTASEKSKIDSLRSHIINYVNSKHAEIGVAIYGLESGDTITIGNEKHYPMQSVYKFHLALAILNQVDKGVFSLDQEIFIRKKDLNSKTWSPIRKKYPKGNIKMKLSEILIYTIAMSDNNGCDILFKLLGGPQKANDYIKSLGIQEISIKATENEMHKSWKAQFTNWTTPLAAVQLLYKFYTQNILSKNCFNFLLEAMVNSSNSSLRIKGQLPKETIVAHKSGTSDTNDKGIQAAVNDIGIVTLPDGRHFAIAVFVSNSKEEFETNESIIAEISKLTWEYFTK
jgi:beta-lactamase class A